MIVNLLHLNRYFKKWNKNNSVKHIKQERKSIRFFVYHVTSIETCVEAVNKLLTNHLVV